MAKADPGPPDDGTATAPQPEYAGHRERLRQRLLGSGAGALADYEILEFLLFSALPRQDTKPIAKALIQRFGSLGGVLAADAADLMQVKGIKEAGAATFKAVLEAARRLAREQVVEKPVLSSWQAVIDYCRIAVGHEPLEQFLLLFLDRKNRLLADEKQQRGTVDHTPVYPREVVKRALDLKASAIVLVHNHPSGDPTPSRLDVETTKEIAAAAAKLGIAVHDHIVIGSAGHFSFRAEGLL